MAFAVDATSHATASQNDANNSITWSHTNGGTANKLTASVGSGGGSLGERQYTSLTYNGVAMTKAVEKDDGIFQNASVWYLDSPATGAHNVVATIGSGTGSTDMAGGAISFIGAAAGAPPSTNTATGTTANPTLTLSSTQSGDICVDSYASDVGPGTNSTPSGTQIWEDEDLDSDSDYGSQRVTASGSSTAMTWTASSTGSAWVLAAVAIRDAGGGGGGTPAPTLMLMGVGT